MSTQTNNYKLMKPDGSDKYNIGVFNSNFELIDTQMKANSEAIGTKQKTVTGAATTVLDTNLIPNKVVISNTAGKIAVSTVTDEELAQLAGVTDNIQDQLADKLPLDGTAVKATGDAEGNPIATTYAKKKDVDASIKSLEESIANARVDVTGAASTIVSTNLTADRVAISNAGGKIGVSAVTTIELECLTGVTSKIQDQLNDKLASDGTAVKATADANGNNIVNTYGTKAEVTVVQTAATNAQTTANSAQTKANEAYALAETKQKAITVSTVEPTSSDGSNGDIWAVYE